MVAEGGPAFVDTLRRVWDAGDALLPVDQRLPTPARERLLGRLAPGRVIEADGSVSERAGGLPVEDGDAVVVPTSGSTGEVKGVVLTHDAVRASALAVHGRLGMDPDRHRWLSCLPLSHVAGLAVVMRGLVTGTPVEVHGGFDAAAVEVAARSGATHATLVPTALARIDASLFECIVVGGSAPPANLPPNVVTSYAMTETGSSVVYDGLPLDGVDLAIADDGEIRVRGPMLLRCYRNGVDPKDPDGWLATGDLGRVDGDGRLHVQGRRGDLIITGGENVWPTPVEAALVAHPAVAEVAVAGVTDPEWGQRVVAYVVPADAAAPPSLDDLRHEVRQTLPSFMAPREVVLRDQLPRTAVGKVRRAALTRQTGPESPHRHQPDAEGAPTEEEPV